MRVRSVIRKSYHDDIKIPYDTKNQIVKMPYVIIIVVCIKAYIGVDLDKPPAREAARNVGPCCPTPLHICIISTSLQHALMTLLEWWGMVKQKPLPPTHCQLYINGNVDVLIYT
jgi:hypothetical protein